MKKTILIVAVAIASLVFIVKSGLLGALFMLLLMGTIPGTHYVIPANIMLLMICATMCIILFYPTIRDVLRNIIDHHVQQTKIASNSPAVKRRLSRI